MQVMQNRKNATRKVLSMKVDYGVSSVGRGPHAGKQWMGSVQGKII